MYETYLPYVNGGRWAISRFVDGQWLSLVQDSYLYHPDDAVNALRAAGVECTKKELDEFFPVRGAQGRCPTLEFLEIFSRIGNKIKKEYGV